MQVQYYERLNEVVNAVGGYLDLETASRWAREAGWKKTAAHGWVCPTCVRHTRSKQEEATDG